MLAGHSATASLLGLPPFCEAAARFVGDAAILLRWLRHDDDGSEPHVCSMYSELAELLLQVVASQFTQITYANFGNVERIGKHFFFTAAEVPHHDTPTLMHTHARTHARKVSVTTLPGSLLSSTLSFSLKSFCRTGR